MAFEDLKAELALLINQMENQPEDPRELYLQIREKLNEMRAFGMPVPEDFGVVETALPDITAGQFRVQNLLLSIDPAMRPRLSAGQPLDGRSLPPTRNRSSRQPVVARAASNAASAPWTEIRAT